MKRTPGRTKRRGQPKRVMPTARDISVYKILNRYRYLPTRFVWRLLPDGVRGLSYKRFQDRLTTLYHEGFLNRPARQWWAVNARYKDCIYELDDGGRGVLRECGVTPRRRGGGKNFSHQLLTNLVQSSMELWCADNPALDYVTWDTILGYRTLPDETRRSSTPFKIPVVVDGGEGIVIPDGEPSGVWFTDQSGTRVALCFLGCEADCGTETLEPLDRRQRQSIAYKFRAYLDIAKRKTYRTHFGFPNMIVPFVTSSEQRKKNMMRVFERITDGEGAPFIIFKTLPHLLSHEKTPEPADLLLTEPWARVGHPPFDVLSELRRMTRERAATTLPQKASVG